MCIRDSPYTYDIGNGPVAIGVFTNLTGSVAGTPYSITITDANGCSTVLDTFLTQPVPLDITDAVVTSNYNGFDVSCAGAQDGGALITHTGGTLPVSYLWSLNAGAQTTVSATGLGAGTYTVTVTDAQGCSVDTLSLIHI